MREALIFLQTAYYNLIHEAFYYSAAAGAGRCIALYGRRASESFLFFFLNSGTKSEKTSCCQQLEGFEDALSPETAGNILLAALNSPLVNFNSGS